LELLVITPEQEVALEIETCSALLENGLHRLHVRKPDWDRDLLREYLTAFPMKFRPRISIHSHHSLAEEMDLGGIHLKAKQSKIINSKVRSSSFHSYAGVAMATNDLSYGFLSPIYDSISKKGYRSKFSTPELESFLSSKRSIKVIALGGITKHNIGQTKRLGFDGAALLGVLWEKKSKNERINVFEKIVRNCS